MLGRGQHQQHQQHQLGRPDHHYYHRGDSRTYFDWLQQQEQQQQQQQHFGSHSSHQPAAPRQYRTESEVALMFAVLGALALTFALFVCGLALFKLYQLRRDESLNDIDNIPDNVRDELLPDEAARHSFETAREFERRHPYGSVRTALTALEREMIAEKGVVAWELVVPGDVNAIQNDLTEVQFFNGENCVMTNLPMPRLSTVSYFEAKLEELPPGTTVSVGLCSKPYPAWRLVGWNKYSVGFFTDEGRIHHSNPFKSVSVGTECFEGDVIGVAYQPFTGTVFFTRNGRRFRSVTSGMTYDLFPAISADGPCTISVNFGQRGFVFIEANVKQWGLAPREGNRPPPPKYGMDDDTLLLEVGEDAPLLAHNDYNASNNAMWRHSSAASALTSTQPSHHNHHHQQHQHQQNQQPPPPFTAQDYSISRHISLRTIPDSHQDDIDIDIDDTIDEIDTDSSLSRNGSLNSNSSAQQQQQQQQQQQRKHLRVRSRTANDMLESTNITAVPMPSSPPPSYSEMDPSHSPSASSTSSASSG